MSTKRLPLVAALGVLVLAMTGCAPAGDTRGENAGTRTLRLALNQSEEHPAFTALENFGTRLHERTRGRWDIEVYPNENLGPQQDVLQLTSDGSVDLSIVSGIQLENLNEDFAVFNLPYVFDSIEHQMRVTTDPDIVDGLYSSLHDRDLSVLGGFTQGFRGVYGARPVIEPSDLQGQKIRVQESAMHADMLDLMGGSATPMSYGEVYTGLQSGVLDGAENNEVSYVTQKHYEVSPHFSRTDHLLGIDYLVANTDRLGQMAPQDRAAFDEEWHTSMREFTGLFAKATDEDIEEAASHGVQFHEVDKAAFREKMAPLTSKALTTDTARELYGKTRAVAP